MRISPTERQDMDRRNRERLPAAARSLFQGLPAFVLIVSATIAFTPEALARMQDSESSPIVMVKQEVAPNILVKTYTKEELSKTMPENPITNLNQRLMTELTGLINGIGSSFRGSDQSKKLEALKTLTPAESDVNFHHAALKDAPKTRKADHFAIRQFMAGEAQKVATTAIKSRIPYVGSIGSGFNFDLNFDTFFGESKQKNPSSGTVRYSLILKDIQPNKGQDRAAISSDVSEELKYAGHADVEWTIGPLMEEHNRKILAEPPMELQQNEARSFFGIRIPKFSFKGNVKPEKFDNLSKINKDSMPSWLFSLSQTEGFYNLTHKSEFGGKSVSTEHLFRTPVAGTIEIGRRFSDKWDVLQTSAYNILYDKRMPLLSVHHLNIEQRYSADLGTKIGDTDVSISARNKAKGTVKKETDRPESYSVNVTKSF
jgi:hypothetical protein